MLTKESSVCSLFVLPCKQVSWVLVPFINALLRFFLGNYCPLCTFFPIVKNDTAWIITLKQVRQKVEFCFKLIIYRTEFL